MQSCTGDDRSTTWNGGGTSTDATWSSTSLNGVGASIQFTTTPSATTGFSSFANVNMTNLAGFSDNSIRGYNSLNLTWSWDTDPENVYDDASDDSGTGLVTIRFGTPVENPVIHFDRIGGDGSENSDPAMTSTSSWEVISPGATLTRLGGPAHFQVISGLSVRREPYVVVNPGGSPSTLDPTEGTAMGSVRVNGTYSTLQFELTADGVEAAGADGLQLVICMPKADAELDTSKSATSVGAVQADGSFDVTYAVTVENSGDVTLDPLTLVDDLTAADQLGSAFSRVTAAPVVSAGTISAGSTLPTTNGAGYDGTNDLITRSGVLVPGDSFVVTFSVNVDPYAAGAPATLQNTATATGLRPGGTPGVDEVSDQSDTDTDPVGDPDSTANVPGGPGDPTVITAPVEVGTIGLVKTAVLNDDDGTDGVSAGDTVDYTYVVTNTSPLVNVYNVSVSEPDTATNDFTGTGTLPNPTHTTGGRDLDGGDGVATDIAPGETVTFASSYTLTQDDVNAGEIANSAVAEGVDPAGNTPTDTSDESNPTVGHDDPTVVALTRTADLSVIKSVSAVTDTNSNTLVDAGDVLIYSFVITNTGNVPLANVRLSDPDANLTSNGPIILDVGEIDTTSFAAQHVLTDANVTAGGFENTAIALGDGVDQFGAPILVGGVGLTAIDMSDSGSEPDVGPVGTPVAVPNPEDSETADLNGNTDADPANDPTVFNLYSPSMSLEKSVAQVLDTNGDGLFGGESDEIIYAFTVTNTGDTTLTGITVSDPMFTVTGGPIDLEPGAADGATFTGSYFVDAADITRGYVENTATADATAEAGGVPLNGLDGNPVPVRDTSDSGTDPDGGTVLSNETVETPDGTSTTDGDPTNDPTVLSVPSNAVPQIDLIKTVTGINDVDGSQTLTEGDIVTYTFSVTNSGNVRLAEVTVTDPRLTPDTLGPLTLEVGDTNTSLTGSATITADEVAQGFIENTAIVTGAAVNSGGNPIRDPNTLAQLTTADTSDAGSQADVGVGGVPDTIDDPTAIETPDGDGNTNGVTNDDPTVLFIPQPGLRVIKSVDNVFDTNGDGLIGGENDEITFVFTVTNIGNTALSGVTIIDSIATVSGGPIDLAIGATDTATFTATYTVNAADFANGYVENSATGTGTATAPGGDPYVGLSGNPIQTTDTSDAGTDPETDPVANPEGIETTDGLGVTDGDPANDPTVVRVPANPEPRIDLVKSVTAINDVDASNTLTAGDIVTYTFTATNTGNVRLADVVVTDPRLTPSTIGTLTLEVGATDSSLRATAAITAIDVSAGFIENTATVSGNAVNSLGGALLDPDTGVQLSAIDTSDTGSETDLGAGGVPGVIADPTLIETPAGDGTTNGTPDDDPTVLFLPQPDMTVTKTVANVFDTNGDGLFGGENDEVEFAFAVTNIGNTALNNISISDSIATVSGGPISLAIGATNSTAFTARYTISAVDFARRYVENTAEGEGFAVDDDGNPYVGLNGVPLVITDTSDTGTDSDGDPIPSNETTETPDGTNATDGDPTNDPTLVAVPVNPEARVSLIKSVTRTNDTNQDQVLVNAGDIVTFGFAVTNTGNVDLANLVVEDAMLGGTIATLPLLSVGQTITVDDIDYLVTDADEAIGYIQNSATAQGDAVNSFGAPLLDLTGRQVEAADISDAGTDPTGATVNEPEFTETPEGNGDTDTDPTNDPTVLRLLQIPSAASVTGTVFLDNNRDGSFEPGLDDTLGGYIVTLYNADGDVVGTTVTAPDGTYMLAGFPVGNDYVLTFADPVTGDTIGTIDDLDFGVLLSYTNQNQPLVASTVAGQYTLSKSSNVDVVIVGQSVSYEIEVATLTGSAFGPVTVVDRLPAGLAFIPGSMTVDGTAATPTISGQTLTIEGLILPSTGSVTVALQVRVLSSAASGNLTNTASLLDGLTGLPLAEDATATVRRQVEAVFECSDVIGKVFDDVDRDGYQDPIPQEDRAQITDQNYGGKFDEPDAVTDPQGEPGIAGVRLVTTDGTIITTDEFGRYSVPCAALPGSIGENFTLKLDTNSLPTGYRMTTENPRTMRLTRGIMTEMNFGASIGRIVDIDLTASAFVSEHQPSAELASGLDGLLAQVQDTPSTLRITYFTNGEGNGVANARLNALEALIQDKWRRVGSYRLVIERTVTRLQ